MSNRVHRIGTLARGARSVETPRGDSTWRGWDANVIESNRLIFSPSRFAAFRALEYIARLCAD
ncbi:MAG: hypothetical protein KGJ80_09675 [Chloroflexota bacterium]|nr:hypothetical protein [Chloroflexota bacterium]